MNHDAPLTTINRRLYQRYLRIAVVHCVAVTGASRDSGFERGAGSPLPVAGSRRCLGMACHGADTRPDRSSVLCPGSALVSLPQPVRVWRNSGVQTGRRRASRRPCNRLCCALQSPARTSEARSLHPAGERANGLLRIVRCRRLALCLRIHSRGVLPQGAPGASGGEPRVKSSRRAKSVLNSRRGP